MPDEVALTKTQKVFSMLGALLGLLLAALDQTIVATAGPRIQKDLAIEPALYVWITTAYLVASTVSVPIYGKLSDLYGRRRILLISIAIFLAGSLACGISQSTSQLIASRALQGIGSGGLFTSAFAVVADLFPPAERGKWQGMFGGAFAVSSVIGPLLGGFISDYFGWHWVFFINLPIGALAVSFILSHMPPLRQSEERRPKLDIAGALALVVATVPLLLALSLGRAEGTDPTGWSWLSWQIFTLVGVSLLGWLAFVIIERRAPNPLLDLRLFKIPTFAIGSVASFVVACTFLGAIVFLPLFMVNVVGLSATSSGLTTTPLTLGIVAANITAGQLVSRLGAYKGLLLGSLAILVTGFSLLALTLSSDATQGSVTLKMVILGVGLGPSIPLFTLAIQTCVPPHQIGVATATATFCRSMGSTMGIAIIGTIFAASFAHTLQRDLPAVTQDLPLQMQQRQAQHSGGESDPRVAFDAAKIKQQVDSQIDQSPMPPPAKEQAKQRAHASVDRMASVFKDAFTNALVNVFWISIFIAGIGLVITIFLPQLPLRSAPEGTRPHPGE